MAASSIIKNFVVSGERQIEMFANAIEESYQESLIKSEDTASVRYRDVRDPDEMEKVVCFPNVPEGYVMSAKAKKQYGLLMDVLDLCAIYY